MRDISLLFALLLLALGQAAAAPPAPRREARGAAKEEAARAFERGQKLYFEGRYGEAAAAFTEAQRLAPHPSALFNIGRCHENLGNVGQAIENYETALRLTTSETEQQDLRKRIARLRAVPVKVFISSQPSGARVTIDGRREAEPQPTPLVVKLKPGEHVLMLRRPGYQLATRRVEVEVEKEQPVEVALEPLPPPCPPPRPPCPPPPVCPDCRLAEFDRLHIHLAVQGTFALTRGRPLAGGPGVQALASYRRWIFGGHFLYLPFEEETLPVKVTVEGRVLDRVQPRLLFGQVEAGRVFPFPSFYTYATLGIGLSADRLVFAGPEAKGDLVRERAAFTWSLGGGIEAMATAWLSFGVTARFGISHGSRYSRDEPTRVEESAVWPYGTIAGIVSFHL